jgi:glycosyltransferase involved in cell wall biosynthesis
MKIGLDARAIYRVNRRGTGKNLIDLYRSLAHRCPAWRFYHFCQAGAGDDPFSGFSNIERRQVDMVGDRFDFWQQIRLPLAAKMAGVDVLHCPGNMSPRWPGVSLVVTIHDLISLEPEFSNSVPRRWGRQIVHAAHKAVRILTPSEYSKRRIVERLGVSEKKIVVNPWAPDSGIRRVTQAEELDRVRKKYGVPAARKYVLAYGASHPRKNTAGVLKMWEAVGAGIRKEYMLVVIGILEPALSEFRGWASEKGLAESCSLHGFAAEEDMSGLLSGAEAMCYLSLIEGFGLPVLDAFVCHTPVLASNTTSIPEVAGEAAVLVDPQDIGAMAAGMTELLGNSKLRGELIDRGNRQVMEFTWAKCATRAAAVFESVFQERVVSCKGNKR